MRHLVFVLSILILSSPAWAHDAEVTQVRAEKAGMLWNFHVTVAHGDTGWDHYADAWEVLDADGNVLALRELLHPHVNEQPFTRSLSGVVLPDGTREVFVRARCTAVGWASQKMRVQLSH